MPFYESGPVRIHYEEVGSGFVVTVSRDFVRSIRTPLLIAPDDVPAHPYKVEPGSLRAGHHHR